MSIEESRVPTQTGTTAELTREEFMIACKADGTDEETCAARWAASHQVSPEVPPGETAPADKYTENAMLRARIKLREDQLKMLLNIENERKAQTDADNAAKKKMLVDSIQLDSPSYSKKYLEGKSLVELNIIRETLDKHLPRTYASVAAQMQSDAARKKPQLTAGYYDSATKTWKGGA